MDSLIIKALQDSQIDVRLTNATDHKWLVWEPEMKEWVVYGRQPGARNTICHINTTDLNEAVEVLTWEEE